MPVSAALELPAMSDLEVVLNIDYGKVRTGQDLVNWACEAFGLTFTEESTDGFLQALFDHLSKQGKRYKVNESNVREMTPEVSRIVNGFGNTTEGWKQVLGFHLFREGAGAQVIFKEKSWFRF
jgi:hypothetical protein